ncbi:SMP-30/gluconolactonase/LRE family protein [Jiangella rhizosphaerae]|uniref:SMP-30/gluconolactonase/LRE family protein n=1 Tax=Jiangella rhizosphaerae TaxID=2293569 RepID=A0A418KGN9_9ACTN|nr:SMP-30/gluconolactonase/LRE family protein [Jiangella rhizosphaerae]RIQ11095.1 SMP-30/gluconolactonase/LRE family protein [Jiangella rhizosphaerae]
MRAEQLTAAVCEHGEGPVQSPRWSGPRWVDMLAGDVLELSPSGEVARRNVGSKVAAVVRPRRGAGWLVATERAVAMAGDDALDAELTSGPELWTDPGIRSNEGGCAPDGAFYLGTMAYDETPGAGTVHRIDPSGAVTTAVENVTISNGLGWSPDGARAYYVDTDIGRIDVFDWSADDGLTGRRPWAEVPGGPDGLTVDAEGGVWVATYWTGEVRRYDADGRLGAVVDLPARRATAVAFAGPGLDELIVTTSRLGLDDAGPGDGALFALREPGVRGLPVLEFGG